MKQKFLLKTMLLLCALVVGSGTMWGQTTTTTCTFSSKAWAANNGGTWTSGKDGNQLSSGRGIQVTTGSSGANGTSGDSFENVSQIVVTYSTNASTGAGSIAVKVGSGTAKAQNVTTTGGTTDRTLTYTFSPFETGKVNIAVTCTTNSIYVKSVAITCTAGDYISAAPKSASISSDGDVAEFSLTTNLSTPSYSIDYYTTSEGNETTTKPSWFGDVEFSDNTLDIEVQENTGVARTAYFKVYSGTTYSDVITINQEAITVATPQFDVTAGTYYEDKSVGIACETTGATIYYTTNNSTPSANNGTVYDGNRVSITANTTLKAIAIKNGVSSEVASAAYTIIHPLTTMDEIFTAATSAGSTATSCYVTFNNWVVTGVKNSQAFVTDGTKGFVIYQSSHGFATGNILSGTAACKVQLYNGFAELTNLKSSTTGLTVSTGGTVSPQVVTIDAMSGVNTGALIQLNRVTYNSTDKVLEDEDGNTITPYTTLYTGSYTNGTMYNIVGVYQQQAEAPHRIMPRSANDIEIVHDPEITAAASLIVPNYAIGTTDPTYETLTVNGSYLTDNITLSLGETSNFEMSTDLDTWTNTLTLTQSNGSVTDEEVAIRLKAGLAKGSYEGTLTLSSTGATNVGVSLSGTVTGQFFAIEQYTAPATAHGTISFSPTSPIEEGTEVTLSVEPAAGYTLTANSWVFYKESGEDFVVDNSITVTDNKFTMPSYALYVDGTFTAKPTYAISCVATPDLSGELISDPEEAYEGQTVSLTYGSAEGYSLSSIVITKTEDGSATNITLTASNDGYTFIMPDYAVTATATFQETATYSLINSSDQLVSGKHYIIVGENNEVYYAMGGQRYNNSGDPTNRKAINVTPDNGVIPETTGVYEFVIYGPDASGYYTIYNANGGYLCAASSSNNYLTSQETNNSNGKWNITFSNNSDVASIVAQGSYSRKTMQYNSSNQIFACYASASQNPVYLYVKNNEATPTEQVTIGESGYASYCSPNALDFTNSDVKAYKAKVNNGSVQLTRVYKVPAGVGVVLHSETSGNYNISTVAGAADAVTENEMVGVLTRTQVEWNPSTGVYNYILQQGVFNKATDGYLKANRAYLSTSYDVSAAGARPLKIVFSDESTGIDTIEHSPLTIDRYYNLKGQRVDNPKKGGLYIMNGKKVVIK